MHIADSYICSVKKYQYSFINRGYPRLNKTHAKKKKEQSILKQQKYNFHNLTLLFSGI